MNRWQCKMCWTHNPDDRLRCGDCGHHYTTGAGGEDAYRLILAECVGIERKVKDGQGD